MSNEKEPNIRLSSVWIPPESNMPSLKEPGTRDVSITYTSRGCLGRRMVPLRKKGKCLYGCRGFRGWERIRKGGQQTRVMGGRGGD